MIDCLLTLRLFNTEVSLSAAAWMQRVGCRDGAAHLTPLPKALELASGFSIGRVNEPALGAPNPLWLC